MLQKSVFKDNFYDETLSKYLCDKRHLPRLEEIIDDCSSNIDYLSEKEFPNVIDFSTFTDEDYLNFYHTEVFPMVEKIFPQKEIIRPNLKLYDGTILNSRKRMSPEFKTEFFRNYFMSSVGFGYFAGSLTTLLSLSNPEIDLQTAFAMGAIAGSMGAALGSVLSLPYTISKFTVNNVLTTGHMTLNDPYTINLNKRRLNNKKLSNNFIRTTSHELVHCIVTQFSKDQLKSGLMYQEGMADFISYKLIESLDTSLYGPIMKSSLEKRKDALIRGYHSVSKFLKIPESEQKYDDLRIKESFLNNPGLELSDPYTVGSTAINLMFEEFGDEIIKVY